MTRAGAEWHPSIVFYRHVNRIGHTAPMPNLALSDDWHIMVSGSWDCTVRLWENIVGEWRPITTFTGLKNWIKWVCVTADGQTIAACADETDINIPHVFSVHPGPHTSVMFGRTLGDFGKMDFLSGG